MNKNFNKIVLVLTVMVLFVVACKKDSKEEEAPVNTPTPSSNYYFRCKINGVPWNASNPKAVYNTEWQSYIVSDGSGGVTNKLEMSITHISDSIWGYWGNGSSYINSLYESYDNQYDNPPSSGSLTLKVIRDSVNSVVSGTFAFPLINFFDNNDTLKITNGEFKVKY